MEEYMLERLEKLLNKLLDQMQEDTHAERSSNSLASIAAYISGMTVPRLEGVIPITNSLASIAQQLTIQNQLTMLRMIREIPSGQQTERYALRTTLDAIEKGVPYLDMFRQPE